MKKVKPTAEENSLKEALEALEREKNISKDSILDAIEQSLITACHKQYGDSTNVRVIMDRDKCTFSCQLEKEVVEYVENPNNQIALGKAQMLDPTLKPGDFITMDVDSKEFGRIATSNAKNVILQKIREEERRVLYSEYYEKERDIVTGVVQRYVGKNLSVNLGKLDALLVEKEMVKSEHFEPNDRIKLYVCEVRTNPKGPKIMVSRTHPELVRRLFETEVTEMAEGIVEIKSIAREAGSRTKIAVWSNDPDVDAVGACVGQNGNRVNEVVEELRGEKIDIINWDDNPANLIQNALSPSKVISVIADAEEKTARVVVPDYQLSLAIGKEGQNARLAAKLTGFKIDIKSESQAREAGDFLDYENDYQDVEESPEYTENTDDFGYTDENGVFHEGYYDEDGVFHEGYYDEAGKFHFGFFDEDGAFHEGYFDEDGAFHYGYYDEDGTFRAGYFDEDGNFNAGYFDEDGTFHPQEG